MITQLTLREILDYYPKTGLFVWKYDMARLAKAGDIAAFMKSATRIYGEFARS